jgi:hypothetical protein
VTVEHTNDLWEPGAGDRNLYVTAAEYNGVPDEALGEAWTGGTFTVEGDAAGGGRAARRARARTASAADDRGRHGVWPRRAALGPCTQAGQVTVELSNFNSIYD